MKKTGTALLLSVILAGCHTIHVPEEELNKTKRITKHSEEFERIEQVLFSAGFRDAELEELDDPRFHIGVVREWAYYALPVFEGKINEVMIGADNHGNFVRISLRTPKPKCNCYEDEIWEEKLRIFEEALDEALNR